MGYVPDGTVIAFVEVTMKHIRYNHPLSSSFNELFSEFDPFSRLLGHRFRDLVSGDSRLPADVFEADDHYVARFQLPGVPKSDVSVNLEPNGELVVSYEREQDSEVAKAGRRLTLPEDANAEEVKAKLEDGILTVTVGKAEVAKPRAITID